MENRETGAFVSGALNRPPEKLVELAYKEQIKALEAKLAKAREALALSHDLLTCNEIQGLAKKAKVRGFAPDVRKIETALKELNQ